MTSVATRSGRTTTTRVTRRVDLLATRALPIAVLAVFVLWFGSAQADDRYWIGLGVQAMWWAIAVIGVNVLLGYAGLLSLGHYAFFLFGGFVGAVWATQDWGLSPWLGFPVAFLAGMVLGALLALTCCHLRGFYLTVVTLAFGLVTAAVAQLLRGPFNGLTGRSVTQPLDTEFSWLDAANPNRFLVGLYWVGAGLLVACLYIVWNLTRSRWGRAYRAIRESELAARACGVPTYWYKVSAFALSAGIVSVAGVLAAQTSLQVAVVDGITTVGQSFRYVIYGFFGGLGTLAGPILGAFLFTIGLGLEPGGESISDRLGGNEQLVLGSAVIAVAILVPQGIVGLLERVWRRRVPRPAQDPPPSAGRPTLERTRRHHDPDGALLELTDLTVHFGGVAALSHLDLEIRPGTVHALIGPNGSGKSTLVNAVTGVHQLNSGTVKLSGREITRLTTDRRTAAGITRTFQTCQIWREMTVLENVMVGAHTVGRAGLARSLVLPPPLRGEEHRIRRKAESLLDFVGLGARAADLAGSLPFADQRRLEIARALASDPDLLILDEPAAGMHPTELGDLTDLVSSLRDSGITVLLIEHHVDVVMALADVVTVLDLGTKLAEGSPEAVRADPRVIDAYLGGSS